MYRAAYAGDAYVYTGRRLGRGSVEAWCDTLSTRYGAPRCSDQQELSSSRKAMTKSPETPASTLAQHMSATDDHVLISHQMILQRTSTEVHSSRTCFCLPTTSTAVAHRLLLFLFQERHAQTSMRTTDQTHVSLARSAASAENSSSSFSPQHAKLACVARHAQATRKVVCIASESRTR